MSEEVSIARCGWQGDFPSFSETEPRTIRIQLQDFLRDVSESQVLAWDESIPPLQHEVGRIVVIDELAREYTALLEYELPLESRRPDVILLINGAVVVLELKGKSFPDQADLDQAAAYARDLGLYHRHCADREVHPVVVPTRAHGYIDRINDVHVCGPDHLHELIQQLQGNWRLGVVRAQDFLAPDAYCPLPTLVQAARELFLHSRIRPIHRARAFTQPAVDEIVRIAHQAAQSHTRHLVLVTGVPGSGKTLVGLSAVHEPSLDDLAVPRASGKPTSPSIFLSGNGPLVEVLQYELKDAGGGGKTFVRGVKDYVKQYLKNQKPPSEHLIVYDEAQRAWDVEQVSREHAYPFPKSEPELFVNFGERIPEWCVLVGLIGSGQEIYVGEEAGLGQWRLAVEQSKEPGKWTVHAPAAVLGQHFDGVGPPTRLESAENLELTVELRYHFASELDEWVDGLLVDDRCWPETSRSDLNTHLATKGRALARRLEEHRYHLRMTRNLEQARAYFVTGRSDASSAGRYAEDPDARFGLLASSRDKSLKRFGIPNDWGSTKNMRLGPWYGDGHESPASCRHLRECVTESGAQGLELDGALLAWGTDLIRDGGRWSDQRARPYRQKNQIRDGFALRLNAYRVLLTRGRDCTILFVPPLPELDETAAWLQEHGMKVLSG